MKTKPFLTMAIIFGIALLGTASAGADLTSELLPSFDNMKLRFGTGKVVNNAGEISPVLPSIPGVASKWWITQWTQPQKISGDQMTQMDPESADASLGTSAYDFNTPDKHLHVWIYRNGPGGHPVYDLFEQGGHLSNGGGSNLFLSAGLMHPATLDHTVVFSTLAKVSQAAANYTTAIAKKSGAVFGTSFVGFGINFPSPVDGSSSVLFLQVTLANSSNRALVRNGCTMSKTGRLIMTAGGWLAGVPPLLFVKDDGQLKQISFSINDYVKKIFSQPAVCYSKALGLQSIPLSNIALNSVVVKSIYVGLETENIDNRKSSQYQGQPQGDIKFGIQLSDLHLRESASD